MDEQQRQKLIRRTQLESDLKQTCLGTISERVSRYLEVDKIKITPNAYWASISAECTLLYRDGYFFACISLCQAVTEAIVRDLCKKNKLQCKSFNAKVNQLFKESKITLNCKNAMNEIWRNRNDYHHLNPTVQNDKGKLQSISKNKVIALDSVESEVFEFEFVNGALKPKYPQYWPTNPNGLLEVFPKFEP